MLPTSFLWRLRDRNSTHAQTHAMTTQTRWLPILEISRGGLLEAQTMGTLQGRSTLWHRPCLGPKLGRCSWGLQHCSVWSCHMGAHGPIMHVFGISGEYWGVLQEHISSPLTHSQSMWGPLGVKRKAKVLVCPFLWASWDPLLDSTSGGLSVGWHGATVQVHLKIIIVYCYAAELSVCRIWDISTCHKKVWKF